MDDNAVTVYIARRPQNKIKGKDISKEKQMQEERLAESETEEKSEGIINSIIPFQENKGKQFLEELGDADIEGQDDLQAFNEFGEELELEQKEKKKIPVIWNVM